jgi:hypothetical protein
MSHHDVREARNIPQNDARIKHKYAAAFTCFAVARPLATKRMGPTLFLSVPRIPSL